jgi:hypothetical protein
MEKQEGNMKGKVMVGVVSVLLGIFLIGILSGVLIPHFGKIVGQVIVTPGEEPEKEVPETMDDCKEGGWENLVTLGGRDFINQGDCVSYVQTRMCEDFELLEGYPNEFDSFGSCVSHFASGGKSGGNGSGGSGGGGGITPPGNPNDEDESEYNLEAGNFSPANNSFFNQSNIDFFVNISAPKVGIQNISLLINGIINQTNNSGAEGVYAWMVELPDGEHNWSILVFDNNNQSYQSNTRIFEINATEPEPEPTITINSPLNQTYNTSEIMLNVSVNGVFNLSSLWYTLDDGTTNTTFESSETPLLNLSDGSYSLIVYANNTEGDEISASVVFTIEIPEIVLGCTDSEATNYNPDATEDDGSCEYDLNTEEINNSVGENGE